MPVSNQYVFFGKMGSFSAHLKKKWIQGLLWFHTNFRIISSGSVKNGVGILIEIALTL